MPPLPGQLSAPFIGAANTGLNAVSLMQQQKAQELKAQYDAARVQLQAQAQAAKLSEQATNVIQGGDPRLATVFLKFNGLEKSALGTLIEESTRSKENSTKALAGAIIGQLGVKGINPKDATPEQLMELGDLISKQIQERRLAGRAAVQSELDRAQTEKVKTETDVKKESLKLIKGEGKEKEGDKFLATSALFGSGAASYMAERDPAAIAQKIVAEEKAKRIRPVSSSDKALFELSSSAGSYEETGIIQPDNEQRKSLMGKKQSLATVKDLAGRIDKVLATRGSKALGATGATTRLLKSTADQIMAMMDQFGIYVDVGTETQKTITSITDSISKDLSLNADQSATLRTQVFNLALAIGGTNGIGEGRSLSDKDLAALLESVGVNPSADTFRAVLAENVSIAQGRVVRDFEQFGAVPKSVREPFKPTIVEATAEVKGYNKMSLDELWRALDAPNLSREDRMAIIKRAQELE